MDTIKQITRLAGKYKYVLIVVLSGLALMLLPKSEAPEPAAVSAQIIQEESLDDLLESILSKIQGVGKVQVLLTEAQGIRTVYVSDESTASDSSKSSTVILTDQNRAQEGLVSQIIPPVYLGAVIVCQGGDIPSVKLSVVEAVSDATGLSADRITVLKMK